MTRKAYAYYGGNKIVPCDWKKSEQALLQLEAMGDSRAANSLDYIYYSNRLGAPDYEKAFYFFSKAAEAGVTEAKYKLADLYRNGHGVTKNEEKAFRMLKAVYDEQLVVIQDRNFACHYADIALRMGYCYEDGAGVAQDYHKAREYFLRAKYAIEMRMLKHDCYGDSTVAHNIDAALNRIKGKGDGEIIIIDDLPGYSGNDTIASENAIVPELQRTIDYLFSCDYFSDEFDPDGEEEHREQAEKVLTEYSFAEFYHASFEWMKNNCKKPEQYINFANLYFYYGGSDFCIDNPYPFLAWLYNGIDWENDKQNADEAYDIFWSVAVELLRNAEIYRGYTDEYDPFTDKKLQEEIKKIN